VKLWSEDLAEVGYRLAYAGKWHVSMEKSPKDYGWEELFAVGGGRRKPIRNREYGRGWKRYTDWAEQPEATERGEGQILRPGYSLYTMYGTREEGNPPDERSVAETVRVLPKLAASGDPWVAYVSCQGPHDPYFVPQRFIDLYNLDEVPLPPNFSDTLEDKPRLYRRMRRMRWGQLSERETRDAIRHFWAYCSYLDDLFGKVLSALDATGQADNTLVLYCSDHGDYCGDHGLFSKGIPCFRGAYHVPAVMRWPSGIKNPNRRVDEFVSVADIAPTFLELAGVQTDRYFTGMSLVPFLRAEKPSEWRDEIHTQCDGVELYVTQRSVMTKEYKYVFNGFDEDELYDLTKDPHEMHNLADDPEYDAIKREMCGRLWRFARKEKDRTHSSYITVGIAPYGPADAFREK
jgi:arylsulfatase A-like enzyme